MKMEKEMEKKMKMEVFESSEENVWKYVFSDKEIILETVLYRYNSFEDRTVICCSVQSGCPVGCSFCGTGSNFLKNIDADTIVYQIKEVLKDKGIEDINSKCEKFQIMFMSMGEPFLNFNNVKEAIEKLNKLYPNAQLLVSTIGVKDDLAFKDFIDLSVRINKVGLQFSIHKSTDTERNILIPYKKKYSLREIRDRGTVWQNATGRNVYLNYCVDKDNSRDLDIENLKNLFSLVTFNFTFSVICESDETMKNKACQDLGLIRNFEKSFLEDGYNTRIFDPAGQDDIGGGCGQLFKIQEFLKNKK
jgi:23S rRNA (adenine2503-C2)-methyltransferase